MKPEAQYKEAPMSVIHGEADGDARGDAKPTGGVGAAAEAKPTGGSGAEAKPTVAEQVLGKPDPEKRMREFFTQTAKRDADAVVPKAIEYSATDLLTIGSALCPPDATDAARVEAGIAFYLLGKAARAVGALREGRLPALDTWDDAGVYAMMGRYTREYKQWP